MSAPHPPHVFEHDYRVTDEQKRRFKHDGFVKLSGFLNPAAVDMLLGRVEIELPRGMAVEFNRGTSGSSRSDPVFNRLQYNFGTDKTDIFDLLACPYFQQALTELTDCDLFLTFELSFEMEKNVSKGLPWHVGIQSFGYQFAEEFGCTLWAPLHPINTNGQRGGMAYVPQHALPGDFFFAADLAVVEAIKARERAGKRTSAQDYVGLRNGVLNAPAMSELLEAHQVEDDFEPGDVLLFNKTVIHRSVKLGEGELPRRAAYALRMVDVNSRYDLHRARLLEFPFEQYGKGLFPYKAVTRFHIEIAEAGANDGDRLSECDYFSNRDRRFIRRVRDEAHT